MRKYSLFLLTFITIFLCNINFAKAENIQTNFKNWGFNDLLNDGGSVWRSADGLSTTIWVNSKWGLLAQLDIYINGDFKANETYITRFTLNFEYADNSLSQFPSWKFDKFLTQAILTANDSNYCSNISNNSNTNYTFECSFTPKANKSSEYIYFYIPSSIRNYNALYPITGVFQPGNQTKMSISSLSTERYDNSNQVIINQNQTIINQNNETNKKLDETNKNLDNINNSLTSEDLPETDKLNNLVGFLPPGPVDSILNIPLSVLNSFLNVLSSSCQPVTIKLPFVENSIKLPCMYEYLSKMTGFTTFMNWASSIGGTILLISYLINLYTWVDNELTLREQTWNDQDQWGGI